ncbi:DUF1254 domain-containing protein [Brucella haematophila]|jgi:hypothetical protein|uniref:DUF1254 domain-containing protein n=1 Tax=Brucella haematophila TaxID=419474 RepID=UPI00110E5ECE|nr:DUF1254 domain-containing protein [Brucella haematophila]TMU95407.1 DUF1254 domain-containing protein [Brucella haematophila]
MNRHLRVFGIALLLGLPTVAFGQSGPTPVTVDNFVRAESDTYIGGLAKQAGGLGNLLHHREPAPIEDHSVIRLNRDTLYSYGIFDLDAGPVTFTLPDPGSRFMSLMAVSQDHYATTVYGAGTHTFDKGMVGTRYVLIGTRILVDPNDPKDIEQVHALQDGIKASQASTGTLELPVYDSASQKKVHDALLVLASTLPNLDKAFGTKTEVDPIRHLIGTAYGWGGNPDKDARYLNVFPGKNDGNVVYRLKVKDVPVDGFWSISVYNAEGFYDKNPYNAYALNSVTAKKDDDGAVSVQFGGCDGKIVNCLPVMKDWNYVVRLYRPRAEILDGSWKFPEPTIAN